MITSFPTAFWWCFDALPTRLVNIFVIYMTIDIENSTRAGTYRLMFPSQRVHSSGNKIK